VEAALFRATKEARPGSIRATIADADGQEKQVTVRISKLRDSLFPVIFRQKDYRKGVPNETTETIAQEAAVEESAVRQLEDGLSSPELRSRRRRTTT
jgi:hypothetical protein